MKQIPLPKGKVALVDETDYERVSVVKWYINDSGYASTKMGGKFVLMHRLVSNAGNSDEVHHVNDNKLDNRKDNLVFCNRSQNLANRPIQKHNTTGFKGVSYDPKNKKFRAAIQFNGKHIFLGRFDGIKDAALAYNNAAMKFFGEFAKPNEIQQENKSC
jgi:hypothetical protein